MGIHRDNILINAVSAPSDMKVRLVDVARQSGVSPSTASRVLNGHTENFTIRDQVRQRVLAAAEDLGFTPNPFIRAMRAKKTWMVAMLGVRDLGWQTRGTDENTINTMIHGLSQAGYEICSTFTKPGRARLDPPLWRVDGCVVISNRSMDDLKKLDASGIPYVVVNGPCGTHGGSVMADDSRGMSIAVDHLVQLGHRRICYLNTRYDDQGEPEQPDRQHISLRSRESAFVKAINERGLDLLEGFNRTDLLAHQGIELALKQGATALISYHHVMAVQHLSALQQAGIHVPQKVSLLCFNDAFPTAEVFPSLTAIAVPGKAMGERATDTLLKLMEGQTLAPRERRVKLEELLIHRQSTSPPDRDQRSY
ncbi:MAG: LacI family transcriptional regulator [Phycisphaerales bacterium]|nr:LacI family transcriptional regulator [Phycisphaerales bacterium]